MIAWTGIPGSSAAIAIVIAGELSNTLLMLGRAGDHEWR